MFSELSRFLQLLRSSSLRTSVFGQTHCATVSRATIFGELGELRQLRPSSLHTSVFGQKHCATVSCAASVSSVSLVSSVHHLSAHQSSADPLCDRELWGAFETCTCSRPRVWWCRWRQQWCYVCVSTAVRILSTAVLRPTPPWMLRSMPSLLWWCGQMQWQRLSVSRQPSASWRCQWRQRRCCVCVSTAVWMLVVSVEAAVAAVCVSTAVRMFRQPSRSWQCRWMQRRCCVCVSTAV